MTEPAKESARERWRSLIEQAQAVGLLGYLDINDAAEHLARSHAEAPMRAGFAFLLDAYYGAAGGYGAEAAWRRQADRFVGGSNREPPDVILRRVSNALPELPPLSSTRFEQSLMLASGSTKVFLSREVRHRRRDIGARAVAPSRPRDVMHGVNGLLDRCGHLRRFVALVAAPESHAFVATTRERASRMAELGITSHPSVTEMASFAVWRVPSAEPDDAGFRAVRSRPTEEAKEREPARRGRGAPTSKKNS